MEYESWETLAVISRMDWFEHSQSQLTEWERKRKSNGFPEPKQIYGRYRFFDPEEVKMWYTLYRKATANMGRGDKINAKR